MSGGGLVVCPTPIGNLGDVTLRALDVLREADVVACEDTRHTGRLLAAHSVRARSLVSYHEHNETSRTPSLVSQMQSGSVVALVTDAGMPSVSDPGYVLIRAAVEQGLRVEVLPGASAPVVAVVLSGLPADRWRFVGFLPRKAADLAAVFASPETTVAFESPRRLVATLSALVDVDPSRPVAVCRELTKVHEEVVRGDAASVAAHFASADPRGEIVVVIGAAPAASTDVPPAVDALAALVEAGAKPRPAAKVVAELTGVAANKLYAELQSRR
ncbi:MAG TPA: 16S rRNA (cytidine(1402)-2'-O)-methyltransferase [Solirubrobacteraceae bacterium]|jgi:16S rRNA (cytidine1402-2'-O)-methyltransferase